jgi:hypothetical protein
MFRLVSHFQAKYTTAVWSIYYSNVIYSLYHSCVFRLKVTDKPKHVADDKLLIKLCIDLFLYIFINSIFKRMGMPCFKQLDDLFNGLEQW